ncbi:hypothetical protein GPALN_010657 [Globodera pallida]|nr:hypothetical protein GPALN_010657 [Globodera pallida]
MTLEERLKPDSEVRINFFNEALEFHDLFGTTVLRVTLRNNTLSFNSFIVSSCKTAIDYKGCCNNFPLFECPEPFKPNCNIFGHNCVACKYVYDEKTCSARVYCSCYYCCDPQYAESCPDGCAGCVKDGEGGCPENSAVNFKSIGNSSSSMLEAEAKAWEHFDMVDVDKNGSISLNEAIDHLETKLKNGTSGKNLAKNVSWFAEMDSNGNNQIEPGEFDRSLIKVDNRTSG